MERFWAFFNFPLLFCLRKMLGMGQIGLKCTNGVLSSRPRWFHSNFIFPPAGIRVYFRVCKYVFLSKNAGHNGTLTV